MVRKSQAKGKSKEFIPSFQGKKTEKHEILGGIKVSSQQLSKWGKLGGRPQKYLTNAEKARAFRLKKKQEKFGFKAELRSYKSYEGKPNKVSSFVRLICDKCQSKSIGGLGHLNQQCFCCYRGKMSEEKVDNIIKRAGSSRERWKRWKAKEENKVFIKQKNQECQHDWETISDFASYGYTQCKKCGIAS